jgi:hypothetical protein
MNIIILVQSIFVKKKYFLLFYPSKCIISCKGSQARKDRNLQTLGQTTSPALGWDVPRPAKAGWAGSSR